MMEKNNKSIRAASLFMAGLLLGGSAAASVAEPPREENFPNFSQYMRALFQYRKEQIAADTSQEKLCSDASKSDGKERKQKNTCDGSAKIISDPDLDANTPHEDLDEAIAKASAGINPGYVDTSPTPRTTFKSFPLSPITSSDLSNMGVTGLLGFLGSLIPANQTPPPTTALLRPDSSETLIPDTGLRLLGDAYSAVIASFELGTISFGGVLHFREGTGTVEATAMPIPGGASLNLSADIHTGLYVVDRDGEPGTPFSNAGALVVDSLGINMQNVQANITAGGSTSNQLLNIQVYSPNAITIDLSSTHAGAADARADQTAIGPATNFLSFGSGSMMTISPGMTMLTSLGHSSGMTTPLITLNGDLGSVQLTDMSLVQGADTILHVGDISVSGLRMVDTKIYLDQQTVVIDLGSGMTNLAMAFERVSMGNAQSNSNLGDFYVLNANVSHMLITARAH